MLAWPSDRATTEALPSLKAQSITTPQGTGAADVGGRLKLDRVACRTWARRPAYTSGLGGCPPRFAGLARKRNHRPATSKTPSPTAIRVFMLPFGALESTREDS